MPEKQNKTDAGNPDLADILEELFSGGKHDPIGKLERLMRVTSDVLSRDTPQENTTDAAIGKGFAETLAMVLSLAIDKPDLLAQHLAEFSKTVLDILMLRAEGAPEPAPSDRRFRDPLWRESPVLRGLMQIYLTWGNSMQSWINAQDLSPQDKLRIDFILRQLAAAFSPSNLPLNPSALKRAEKSHGMSTVAGLKNFFRDIQHNRGMPRQVKPGFFKLGKNLATTPGAVVFRNEHLELIQYRAATEKVHHRPVCLVPPQINKFYAFDLKPANSLLGYLVAQGFQVFTISWKNPGVANASWGIESYITSILSAIEAIRQITDSEQVNLISACAGGLTAMALLGHLNETKQPLVHSHSLLVTALMPGNGSIVEAFTTAENLELARQISKVEGTMDGKDLAHLFVWLRPEDLVWNFWVNNNILGRQPPPLDILYWDNDPTRVPAGLHADFIDMYLHDVFRNPGKQVLFDRAIDYGKISVPTYFVGGEADYLMPWRGIYRAMKVFEGDHRFVLSNSGHVQSILRPPNLSNSEYFVNESYPADPDNWRKGSLRNQGSWWLDWSGWLKNRSGSTGAAPMDLGCPAFPPICAAPGTYVLEPMSNAGPAGRVH